MVHRALIIDEPWISLILSGEKDWEMRTTPCRMRESIGLIRKGSGQIVGVANIVGSSGPHGNLSLERNYSRHRVGADLYKNSNYNWRYAWELDHVIAFESPVTYDHQSGQVKWVKLQVSETQTLKHQIENSTTM
ncbi:MAG: hypothetical protein C9356_02680 [Oleiphilus sp.]|nr:MAG: hypothetical protein C9356_02680 [Oleiphilus sp.]